MRITIKILILTFVANGLESAVNGYRPYAMSISIPTVPKMKMFSTAKNFYRNYDFLYENSQNSCLNILTRNNAKGCIDFVGIRANDFLVIESSLTVTASDN